MAERDQPQQPKIRPAEHQLETMDFYVGLHALHALAHAWPSRLEPGQIGLGLTDGFMMDPEASVSALVFHHPEAKYFKAE